VADITHCRGHAIYNSVALYALGAVSIVQLPETSTQNIVTGTRDLFVLASSSAVYISHLYSDHLLCTVLQLQDVMLRC
jgi:hypothetical protein